MRARGGRSEDGTRYGDRLDGRLDLDHLDIDHFDVNHFNNDHHHVDERPQGEQQLLVDGVRQEARGAADDGGSVEAGHHAQGHPRAPGGCGPGDVVALAQGGMVGRVRKEASHW